MNEGTGNSGFNNERESFKDQMEARYRERTTLGLVLPDSSSKCMLPYHLEDTGDSSITQKSEDPAKLVEADAEVSSILAKRPAMKDLITRFESRSLTASEASKPTSSENLAVSRSQSEDFKMKLLKHEHLPLDDKVTDVNETAALAISETVKTALTLLKVSETIGSCLTPQIISEPEESSLTQEKISESKTSDLTPKIFSETLKTSFNDVQKSPIENLEKPLEGPQTLNTKILEQIDLHGEGEAKIDMDLEPKEINIAGCDEDVEIEKIVENESPIFQTTNIRDIAGLKARPKKDEKYTVHKKEWNKGSSVFSVPPSGSPRTSTPKPDRKKPAKIERSRNSRRHSDSIQRPQSVLSKACAKAFESSGNLPCSSVSLASHHEPVSRKTPTNTQVRIFKRNMIKNENKTTFLPETTEKKSTAMERYIKFLKSTTPPPLTTHTGPQELSKSPKVNSVKRLSKSNSLVKVVRANIFNSAPTSPVGNTVSNAKNKPIPKTTPDRLQNTAQIQPRLKKTPRSTTATPTRVHDSMLPKKVSHSHTCLADRKRDTPKCLMSKDKKSIFTSDKNRRSPEFTKNDDICLKYKKSESVYVSNKADCISTSIENNLSVQPFETPPKNDDAQNGIQEIKDNDSSVKEDVISFELHDAVNDISSDGSISPMIEDDCFVDHEIDQINKPSFEVTEQNNSDTPSEHTEEKLLIMSTNKQLQNIPTFPSNSDTVVRKRDSNSLDFISDTKAPSLSPLKHFQVKESNSESSLNREVSDLAKRLIKANKLADNELANNELLPCYKNESEKNFLTLETNFEMNDESFFLNLEDTLKTFRCGSINKKNAPEEIGAVVFQQEMEDKSQDLRNIQEPLEKSEDCTDTEYFQGNENNQVERIFIPEEQPESYENYSDTPSESNMRKLEHQLLGSNTIQYNFEYPSTTEETTLEINPRDADAVGANFLHRVSTPVSPLKFERIDNTPNMEAIQILLERNRFAETAKRSEKDSEEVCKILPNIDTPMPSVDQSKLKFCAPLEKDGNPNLPTFGEVTYHFGKTNKETPTSTPEPPKLPAVKKKKKQDVTEQLERSEKQKRVKKSKVKNQNSVTDISSDLIGVKTKRRKKKTTHDDISVSKNSEVLSSNVKKRSKKLNLDKTSPSVTPLTVQNSRETFKKHFSVRHTTPEKSPQWSYNFSTQSSMTSVRSGSSIRQYLSPVTLRSPSPQEKPSPQPWQIPNIRPVHPLSCAPTERFPIWSQIPIAIPGVILAHIPLKVAMNHRRWWEDITDTDKPSKLPLSKTFSAVLDSAIVSEWAMHSWCETVKQEQTNSVSRCWNSFILKPQIDKTRSNKVQSYFATRAIFLCAAVFVLWLCQMVYSFYQIEKSLYKYECKEGDEICEIKEGMV